MASNIVLAVDQNGHPVQALTKGILTCSGLAVPANAAAAALVVAVPTDGVQTVVVYVPSGGPDLLITNAAGSLAWIVSAGTRDVIDVATYGLGTIYCKSSAAGFTARVTELG
jgi:hypothetical protein